MRVRDLFIVFAATAGSALLAAEQLEPVAVQSTVFEGQTEDQFAQSANVIHGQELQAKQADTIGETVSNELGVSSTYFGPGASRPIIRGLGSNRVRVLENGIGALDVSSLSEDHAVSIEPYFARQVEILRGPATLRYGPGAIGGIVNVVNRRLPKSLDGEPLELNAVVEHATVSDTNTAAVELNGVSQSFAWHLNGLTRDSNDYDIDGFANEAERENKGRLKNSDVETDNYGFGASLIGDGGMLGASFSRFDSNYAVPGAEEGDIRIDIKQYRYDAQMALFNPFSAIESITLQAAFNNYRHFEIEASGEVATEFDNEELESRLEWVHKVNQQWRNAFGLQYNDREFSALGEEAFIQPVDEKRYGAFAITRFENPRWDVETGLRFDRDKFDPQSAQDESFNVFSISFGAQRKFAGNVQFNLYAARAERAPQETALYASGPHLATLTFETGSTEIDEETAYSIELGLEQTRAALSWKINTYYNRIDDFIYLASVDRNRDGIADRVNEEGVFELGGELLSGIYRNEDAVFYGVEAEVNRQLMQSQAYTVNGRVFADYVRAEFRDDDLGNVPRIPAARLGFGLAGSRAGWNGGVDLIFVADQNKEADLETDTDGYTMLNANINKTFRAGASDINLFLKGENLLDEDARRHSSFQKQRVVLPGRGIKVGMRLAY